MYKQIRINISPLIARTNNKYSWMDVFALAVKPSQKLSQMNISHQSNARAQKKLGDCRYIDRTHE